MEKRKVLFLCTGNSCRSHMAEATSALRADPAKTDDMADFRAVQDMIAKEIPPLLK